MKLERKLTIISSCFSNLGGVANHYRGLRKHWNVEVSHLTVGSRNGRPGLFYFHADVYRILRKIDRGAHYLINPSVAYGSLLRDTIITFVLRLNRVEYSWHLHGWDDALAEKFFKLKLVNILLGKKRILVLAKSHCELLHRLGYSKVTLTTTKVDDDLLVPSLPRLIKSYDILFVGRLIRNKGGLDLLAAIKILENREDICFNVCIAGDGPDLTEMRLYAEELQSNVNFAGYVRDADLGALYASSKRLVLPTKHNEGLPTVILEALCFGLPVISTKVGGIVDVVDIHNGILLERDFAVQELADIIKQSLDFEAYDSNKISRSSHRFLASNVAKYIERSILS